MSDNQVVVIEQMPANEVANSGADMAQIIYILYLVGYAVPATALAGMFLATINRKTAASWVASHMTYQLRTFWIGLLMATIGTILLAVVVGWAIYLLWGVWTLVRVIKGMTLLSARQAHPHPASWGFG